jgi:PhnB protein
MKLHTYLNYPGSCAEAFHFYEKHLGAKMIMMMKHGEMPGPGNVAPDWKDKVLHARIDLGETALMGADIPNAQPMRSAYLSLSVDSDAEAERIYALLSEGGEIFMPMQETFFATRFAQLRDRFGTSWMLVHEKPMPPRP